MTDSVWLAHGVHMFTQTLKPAPPQIECCAHPWSTCSPDPTGSTDTPSSSSRPGPWATPAPKVVAVRRDTPRSVTHHARTERGVHCRTLTARRPARHPRPSRSTAAGRPAATRLPTPRVSALIELTIGLPRRRAGVDSPVRECRTRHGRGARQSAAATSSSPTTGRDASCFVSGRQRHHPGDVDAAHAAGRRLTTARSPSSTTPAAPRRRATATSSPPCPACTVLHGYTRAPDVGDLGGNFDARPSRRRVPPAKGRPGRGLRLRSARAGRRRRARCARRARSESFVPPVFVVPAEASGGTVSPSPTAASTSPTTDARCSSRPRPPGLTPAERMPDGHLPHLHPPQDQRCGASNLITGAVSTTDGEDVQICVTAPVGDVELAL